MISVGISTDGTPCLESAGEYVRLRNMLIGKDFHWQKSIEALLPGEVVLTGREDFPVINRLPVEDYLECVVGSEMNPEAPREFLKAHAVISRSWVIGKIKGTHLSDGSGKVNTPDRIINWEDTGDHIGFDVCSDDHCQRYQGVQPIPAEILSAIRETEGEILIDRYGEVVDARFSKCCGGCTEVFSSCWQDRTVECLESIEDPWCDLSGLSPDARERVLKGILKDYDRKNAGGYQWETSVRTSEIRRNLKEKFGRDIGEIRDVRVVDRGVSGRAILLRLDGERGSIEIGKELMIRRLLAPTHLFSSRIKINRDKSDPELYNISGRGWGHGVGLCQIGAANMALSDHDYHSILSFYYPGSIISKRKS